MSDFVVHITSYLSPAAVEGIGFYTVTFVGAAMILRLVLPANVQKKIKVKINAAVNLPVQLVQSIAAWR